MQLNTVVLPAPFGPISAVMSPRAAENERSSTATSPPKRMVRCSTRSTGAVPGRVTRSLRYLPLKGGGRLRSSRVGVVCSTPPRIACGDPSLPFQGRMKKKGSSVPFLDVGAEDGAALLVEGGRLARADEAARLPDHDQHHGEAEDQHAVLRRIEVVAEDVFQEIELAHDLRAADHHDGRNRDADLAAH